MRSIIDLVDAALSGGGDVADAEVDVVALALEALPAEGGPAGLRPPLPGEPVVEAVVELFLVVAVVVAVVAGVLAADVLAGDGAQVAWEDGMHTSHDGTTSRTFVLFLFRFQLVHGPITSQIRIMNHFSAFFES